MTFAIGHVQGGTNAGRKRVLEPAGEWPCICAAVPTYNDFVAANASGPVEMVFPMRIRVGEETVTIERKVNRGGLLSCPDCGEKRPGRRGRNASNS